jgi:nucleotide-binding universal stress UspA family protein
MEPLNVILIPTDYSDNARIAAEYAVENFATEGLAFWLVNVYRLKYSGAIISVDLDELMRSDSESSMEAELKFMQRKYPNLTIKGRTFQGALVDVITKLVGSKEISMIVMGTKGASGVKEVVLGSNAANVIKMLPVPVLLVPETLGSNVIKTILFATDLKYIKGYETIQPLHSVARKSQANLEILHLSNGEVLPEEMLKEELRLDTIFRDIPHKFHFKNQVVP